MSPAQAQHIHELIASLRLAQARERGELVRRAALALGKTPKTVYRMLKAAGWDEGFGSLDEESLAQAIRALTGLTEGKRLVGIISHVTELKEKIEKQIVVTKEKTGGSRVEIVV